MPNRKSEMTLDLFTLYAATGTAKLADLAAYEARVKQLVPSGADVALTGNAPIGLYLRIARALHERARQLFPDSPVTGPLPICNHDPR